MKRADMPAQYRVDGLPLTILNRITAFQNAVDEYAFLGSAPPEDRDIIEKRLCETRYQLELSIKSQLNRKLSK